MKIALLAASFPLSESQDSAFPATLQLAQALVAGGHDVRVFTRAPETQVHEKFSTTIFGVPVLAIRNDLPRQRTLFSGLQQVGVFSWQLALARTFFDDFASDIEVFSPDVIECQEFNGLGFFYAAARQYPLVLRCYGPMSLLMRSGDAGQFPPADIELAESMELSTVSCADGLISICADLADRLSEKTGRPRSDFSVIKTPFVVPSVIPRAAAADRDFGDAPTLFYFGRVEEQKGLDILVESLPAVAAKFPNFKLRIGGEETIPAGSKEPYAKYLRARLGELGLVNNVEFIGFMSRDRIRAEVSNADICVFASKYETACYTVLEAITYGGIAVATKVGGLPEYHQHRDSCFLVEPRSPEALAAGVIEVLSDAALRDRMRAMAPDYVRNVCAVGPIAESSIEVYKNAVRSFAEKQKCDFAGSNPLRALQILINGLLNASKDASLREQWLTSGAYAEELDRAYHNGMKAGQEQGPQSVANLVWAAARMTKRFVTKRHMGAKV